MERLLVAAGDRKGERRAIAAVILGYDAQLPPFARRTGDKSPVAHDRVAVQPVAFGHGEADRFVARGDLQRIAGHHVAIAGFVERIAVHPVLENRLPVHFERHAIETERIVHAVLAVGGFQHEVAQPSDRQRVGAVQAVVAPRGAPDREAAPRSGDGQPAECVHLEVVQPQQQGGDVVRNPDDAGGYRVERALGGGVAYLEMEVGPERLARVPREGDALALPHGKAAPCGVEVHTVAPLSVAFLPHIGFDVVPELREVAVNRRRAVGMGDVERPSVTRRGDQDAHYLAVGCCEHGFARHAVGFDVHAGVEVIGPHFAEIGGERPDRAADGIDVIGGVGSLCCRRKHRGEQGQRCCAADQKSEHGSGPASPASLFASSSTVSYS